MPVCLTPGVTPLTLGRTGGGGGWMPSPHKVFLIFLLSLTPGVHDTPLIMAKVKKHPINTLNKQNKNNMRLQSGLCCI